MHNVLDKFYASGNARKGNEATLSDQVLGQVEHEKRKASRTAGILVTKVG